VVVYGNTLVSTNVMASGTGGTLCDFASVFETIEQFESLQPLCVAAQLAECTNLHLPNAAVENATLVKQYVPFAINSLAYDAAFESDSVLEGGCNREGDLPQDGPDSQNIDDDDTCLDLGGCFISHTTAGEYLIYRFGHYSSYEVNGVVNVYVTVRVASGSPRTFTLELVYNNDAEVAYAQSFSTIGDGFDNYEDITWTNIPLRASESIHSIKIEFTDGAVNLCSVSADYMGTMAPIGSQLFSESPVVAPAAAPVSSPPPIVNSTIAPVALTTSAPVAPAAAPVSSPIPIVNSTVAPVALTTSAPVAPAAAPVSSPAPIVNSTVAPVAVTTSAPVAPADAPVSLPAPIVNSTVAPVASTTSAPVAPAAAPVSSPAPIVASTLAPVATTQDVRPNEIVVPGQYSALYFTVESELDLTDGRRGDCPERPESFVDAQVNQDAVCAQAINAYGTTCHIAFTEDGEFLIYDFRKNPLQTSVKVTLRTAAKNPRLLQVAILSQDESEQIAVFDLYNPSTGSGETFDTFTVWDQIDIGSEEYYRLKITFWDGSVNLCSVGIE
jgi:hypothetical protein